jgi:hypothetical protein
MLLLALALQTAAPDIELRADVRARQVTIEKQGDARLTVTTSPEGANLVDVQAPRANGRKTLRNVNVSVRAEARIADPSASAEIRTGSETTPPQ